jgi:hypothetical protein
MWPLLFKHQKKGNVKKDKLMLIKCKDFRGERVLSPK